MMCFAKSSNPGNAGWPSPPHWRLWDETFVAGFPRPSGFDSSFHRDRSWPPSLRPAGRSRARRVSAVAPNRHARRLRKPLQLTTRRPGHDGSKHRCCAIRQGPKAFPSDYFFPLLQTSSRAPLKAERVQRASSVLVVLSSFGLGTADSGGKPGGSGRARRLRSFLTVGRGWRAACNRLSRTKTMVVIMPATNTTARLPNTTRLHTIPTQYRYLQSRHR